MHGARSFAATLPFREALIPLVFPAKTLHHIVTYDRYDSAVTLPNPVIRDNPTHEDGALANSPVLADGLDQQSCHG